MYSPHFDQKTQKKISNRVFKIFEKNSKILNSNIFLTDKISVPLQLSDEYMIRDASNNDITRLKLKKNRFSFGICRKFTKIGENRNFTVFRGVNTINY